MSAMQTEGGLNMGLQSSVRLANSRNSSTKTLKQNNQEEQKAPSFLFN